MNLQRDRLDRAAAMLDRVVLPCLARSTRIIALEVAIALALQLVDALPVDAFVTRGSTARN